MSASTNVSGTINTNTTWTTTGSPYIVTATLIVAASTTLTINPGVVVKMPSTAYTFFVYGTLSAVGNSTNRIIFTSQQDDTAGGDTNGDGSATQGSIGQWNAITMSGASASGVFEYADVRYGGHGSAGPAADYNYAMIVAQSGGSATLDYCTLTYSERSGITIGQSSYGTIQHTEAKYNAYGVSALQATLAISANSKLNYNTNRGLHLIYTYSWTGAPATMMDSEAIGNTISGIVLVVDSALGTAYLPKGSRNNIYDNGGGADASQLFSLHSLPTADWTGNYWGENVTERPCTWAQTGYFPWQLTTNPPLTYCVTPGPGPVYYLNQYVFVPGQCNNSPMICAADLVKDYPFETSLIDNSGK